MTTTDQNFDSAQRYQQAQQLWQAGSYETAIAAFRQVAEAAPENGEYLLSLAKAVCNFGYNGDMLQRLESHCAKHTDDVEAALFLCQAQIGYVDHQHILDRCAASIQKAPQHLRTQLFYQSYLVLLGLAEPESLKRFAIEPRELASVQAVLLCNQAKNAARIFGLPAEVLRFAASVAKPNGLAIECGVYFGKSIKLLATELRQPIYGFDSFEGLPEDWKENEPKGSYSTKGKLPPVPENVTLIKGWFEDTLPAFMAQQTTPISILHVDCDLYSSTKTVLESCRPALQAGSIIVFDDLLGYPGWEQHEWRAFIEFVTAHQIKFRFLAFALLAREVAVELL